MMKETTRPRTDQEIFAEYMEQEAVRCPLCGSEDITGGFGEFGEGRAYQNITCANCHTTWVDHYTLTAIAIEYVGPSVSYAASGRPLPATQ